MQKEGPENKYTRMPLIQQLVEMGWDINQMQSCRHALASIGAYGHKSFA